MLNFVIVVDDAGSLETLKREDFDEVPASLLNDWINTILDDRAIKDGTYDPSQNDTPIVFKENADD